MPYLRTWGGFGWFGGLPGALGGLGGHLVANWGGKWATGHTQKTSLIRTRQLGSK